VKTLTRLEAAAFMNCDKSVVSKLYATGQLGAKIGRRLVFIESDLEAFMRAETDRQTARLRAAQALIQSYRGRGRPRRVLPEFAGQG
jgi:hypothetical protein